MVLKKWLFIYNLGFVHVVLKFIRIYKLNQGWFHHVSFVICYQDWPKVVGGLKSEKMK
jgi:hypothetical protein